MQQDRSFKCAQNHSFDVAKSGYLNLLLAHKMKSKQPGDDKNMVKARQDFLNSQSYLPVVESIAEKIKQYLPDNSVLLDAGCGEGYYTEQLDNLDNIHQTYGFDISKFAILAASKRNKNINWSIASVNDIPLSPNSINGIVSIFCRVDPESFAKVLVEQGYLFHVGPGDNHLPNLRKHLYGKVRPYAADKHENELIERYDLIETVPVQFEFNVSDAALCKQLLTMTPHYWASNPEQQQGLFQKAPFLDRVDMKLMIFKAKPS